MTDIQDIKETSNKIEHKKELKYCSFYQQSTAFAWKN